MKNKKVISIIMIYFFIITLIPMSFLAKEVQALEEYNKYDLKNTEISNKYNINGRILKVEEYEDYTLALTGDALYFIQGDKTKKYDLGKMDIYPQTNIKRQGKYIYLTPYKRNSMYKLLTIDTEKFEGKSNFISEYLPYYDYMYDPKLQEVTQDSNGNKWFSIYKSSGTYELLRVNSSSENDVKLISSLNLNEDFHYDDAYTNLKVDSKENAWFKITENDYKIKKYKLARIDSNGAEKTYEFKDVIREYTLGDDGSIWAIHKESLIHLSEDGQVIKEFKGTNIKDISIDEEGQVWILDDDKIKEVVNDELKDRYTVFKESKEISVFNKDNITVRNARGLMLINKGNIEHVPVGSYVGNAALVLSDDASDVRILSDNYRYSEDEKYIDDVLLEVALKDGEFNIENSVPNRLRSYFTAVYYNGETYFSNNKGVFRLKGNSLEEYVKLSSDESYYDYITDMNFDKNGVLYVLGWEKLYVVNKDKSVEIIELSEININANSYSNNLLKDKNGDVYLGSKTLNGMKLIKLNGTNFRGINYKSQYGEEPANIFLNENDEFEFVYRDDSNGFKVYKLDENLLPQEDVRFSNQGSALVQTYNEIRSVKKTGDGKLIMWIGHNMLYMKEKNKTNFVGLYDIKSGDNISSMIEGNDGKVYIGTYGSGVFCYGDKLDILPGEYDSKPVDGEEVVGENKEWTINFSLSLDKNTVNEENVIVIDTKGDKQDVKVDLSTDKASIKLAPAKSYKIGESYYIIIREDIKSLSGKRLTKPVLVKFTVGSASEGVDKGDDKDNSEPIEDTDEEPIEEVNADELKFKIIEPETLEVREKSFMNFIIDTWKNSFQGEVGVVTIDNISVGGDTAVISFDAEVLVTKEGKLAGETRTIELNCKKVDGIWNITE